MGKVYLLTIYYQYKWEWRKVKMTQPLCEGKKRIQQQRPQPLQQLHTHQYTEGYNIEHCQQRKTTTTTTIKLLVPSIYNLSLCTHLRPLCKYFFPSVHFNSFLILTFSLLKSYKAAKFFLMYRNETSSFISLHTSLLIWEKCTESLLLYKRFSYIPYRHTDRHAENIEIKTSVL